MTRDEALKVLEDGHTIWAPEHAKEVCSTLDIEWSDRLVKNYGTDTSNPNPKHNLYMQPEYENTDGVYSLELSAHCAKTLGLGDAAGHLNGRGFRAKAYARAIREKLGG
jgi:hypothetical protein